MNPITAKAAAMLRNGDGTINWKLIGILGLGLAVVAAVMGYVKERKADLSGTGKVSGG